MEGCSRRTLMRGLGAGAASALLPRAARAAEAARLKVVCIGGHPDDPELGCGGTLALYRRRGHAVTIVYLTRGEAGIAGKSSAEAAAIRSAEAAAACRLLGARPVFFGQVDGAAELTSAAVLRMEHLLRAEAPQVVLAHWPIDSHLDHQIAGALALQATLAARLPAALFFYEVMTGTQTLAFTPTDYVDIGPTHATKRAAALAHASQPVAAVYREHHAPMEALRGREAGVTAAEAFAAVPRLAPGAGALPGLESGTISR